MAQQPWFMRSGSNQFHHDQAMDDLSRKILLLSLQNRAQEERIRMEWMKIMQLRIQTQVLIRYPFPSSFGPVLHNNTGTGPYQHPVWPFLPKSKGTGVFFPNYNWGHYHSAGNAQKKKPAKSKWNKVQGKKGSSTKVSCHASPELALPKEWPY